ncbi:MAG: beta strand repeat-containing protein, partial [Planctomycetota bacterium]
VEIRSSARDGINTRTGNAVSPATTAVRSNITIRNTWVYANLPSRTNAVNGIVFGEHTSNSAQAFSAQISNVTIKDNYIDLTTSSTVASPTNTNPTGARGIVFTNMFRNSGASLEYTGLVVQDNTVFSTYQTILQAQVQTKMLGATFTGNTIGKSRSGPSLPTLLAGSVFSNNKIQDINPGSDYYSNLAGAYLGVVNSTVSNNTFSNIGGTAGLVLAGGRSADATYFPASSNSTVSGNNFTYNDQAVSSLAGYTSGILFESNTVATAVNVNGWLTGRQPGTTGAVASTITLSGNTFVDAASSASLPSVAIAQESFGTTLNAVNATPNVFNGTSLTGTTTTADLFTIADEVADVVDATNLGSVTLKSGNVYVTPGSFWAASSTTEADVARAVAVATASGNVWVKAGAYAATSATATVDNLTVDLPAGVTGFVGVVLDASVTNGSATLTGAADANLTGNTGNNTLTGNAGDNTISGDAGNDTLTGGGGTNTLDGGTGTDTAIFDGNYADYTLSFSGSNVVVTRTAGGSSVDTVTKVEKLQFADKTVIVVGSAVGSAYTTIAQGIAAASTGNVVLVAAGTYSENVTINKSITLLGAQFGVKATGSVRSGGETVINGTGASSSYVVTVEADDVTIDGVEVEIRLSARDGINTRTGNAVSPATTAVRSNITIRNTWVYANLPSRTNAVNGIVFGEHTSNSAQAFSAQISNVTIKDNYIDLTTTSTAASPSATSITGARGIVFTNMFRNSGASLEYTGLVVQDNTVFSTYQTILQAQLQTKMLGATFTGNTIGNSRSGPSLPTLLAGSVFSNNTITNINPGSDYYSNLAGAYLGVVNSTVSNNTFSNIGGTAGLVLAGG